MLTVFPIHFFDQLSITPLYATPLLYTKDQFEESKEVQASIKYGRGEIDLAYVWPLCIE